MFYDNTEIITTNLPEQINEGYGFGTKRLIFCLKDDNFFFGIF